MRRLMAVLAVMVAMSAASAVMAQDQPGGGGGQPGGGRGRGGFDPAQIEKFYKDQLGVNDDEWKVLQPKIEKARKTRDEVRGGGGFMFGGGRGRGNPGGDQPQSATAAARDALRKALENKDTPADDIKAKLAAYRDARTKAKADYDAAQKELKELLTARQEAVLVQMGTLE